ncbi:MAG TPA: LysR family transcriptional regulator [Myxococcota bacterium]|jgi:DNA-binding transcriptional LysR family regulator
MNNRSPAQAARSQPNLASVDLNLLVVLDALLESGTATIAAAQLGRTQSAVSHALARLRHTFDDPLFVRAGSRLVATARCEALRAPLAELLDRTRSLLAPREVKPHELRRAFTILSTDLVDATVMPAFLARLAEHAPGIDIRTRTAQGISIEDAVRGGLVDLAFIRRFKVTADVAVEELFDDAFALVVRKGHPALKHKIDLHAYCALDHVMVTPGGAPGGPVDDELAARGLERRVVFKTPSFAAALAVVKCSDLAIALPSCFVKSLDHSGELALRPLPLEVPRLAFRLAWSRAVDADGAHSFLRTTFKRAVLDTLAPIARVQ